MLLNRSCGWTVLHEVLFLVSSALVLACVTRFPEDGFSNVRKCGYSRGADVSGYIVALYCISSH